MDNDSGNSKEVLLIKQYSHSTVVVTKRGKSSGLQYNYKSLSVKTQKKEHMRKISLASVTDVKG